MVYYFTSITSNYFAKARVLVSSLKKYNPETKFVLAISGSFPDKIVIENEQFDHIIEINELDNIGNKDIFFFKHNVTELCTAVKPFVAEHIIKNFFADKVIYLDPDIAVFNSLDNLDLLLDKFDILLTPHQTKPETIDRYIINNEILFLKRGTFNLGFFGVNNSDEGLRFLKWWQSRLYDYCFDDKYQVIKELQRDGLLGLFTDQKWIDLVPSFFNNYHIIKDPGYNVCTWNLSSQCISMGGDGFYLSNGKPLCFFHFSGFDSGGHHNEMMEILHHYPHNSTAFELTKWYEKELVKNEQEYFGELSLPYALYSNGVLIQDFERKIFHIRKDLHSKFINPFSVDDDFCFYNWIRDEYQNYFKSNFVEKFSFAELLRNVSVYLLPLASKRRMLIKRIYYKLLR